MMMNAVQAAKQINFADSLAFMPGMRTHVKARDIYRLSAEIAFGRETASSTIERVSASLRLAGVSDHAFEALRSERLSGSRLSQVHMDAFKRISDAANDEGVDFQTVVEKSFAEDGNGVPAIAILIVIVVVFVAVVQQNQAI